MGHREPLLHKGGLAVDSYKSKGPTDLMPSYRSILLNNTVAKHHHRFLRDCALAVFGHLLRPAQCGGLPGKGVDVRAR